MAKSNVNSAAVALMFAKLNGDDDASIKDFIEVKGDERVKKHGEVFTPAWVVKDMCDIVPLLGNKDDSFSVEEKLNATVLEPTCGSGNFLVEVLERKLKLTKSVEDIIKAVTSIYGVDIQEDNVIQSRDRMSRVLTKFLADNNITLPQKIIDVLKKCIELNIVWGDTLKNARLTTSESKEVVPDGDLYFYSWRTEVNKLKGYKSFGDSDIVSDECDVEFTLSEES